MTPPVQPPVEPPIELPIEPTDPAAEPVPLLQVAGVSKGFPGRRGRGGAGRGPSLAASAGRR
jgi:hypothetical protein